ncbi:ribbon-helix-helix domain-containing protein [Acidisoma cellulosilytica]|uniref:Ribbon-helix-helix domain-containing protein n=1 Tax=Acidisoma cellulosilyticum TaxID=2802395 RepID=A0A963Z539_9PROT|nr:ribbon-helix-helix domain-containing protein [Acidisoma cellulosilyticum]MCB8882952.1 ribbon-helix-helix domain-containing protein [Acidisoma cellulosilyticum]
MANKTPLSPNLVALGVPRGQAKSEQHLPGALAEPAEEAPPLLPSLPSPPVHEPENAQAVVESEEEAAPLPAVKATRQAPRQSTQEPRKEHPKVASSSVSKFARKQTAEARSGITIRVRVSAAERLDNLAKRTGISKQDLLDQAIQEMLDAADQEGNLTAPLT